MFHPITERAKHGLTVRKSLEAQIIGYVDSESDETGKWPIRVLTGGYVYCTCPDFLDPQQRKPTGGKTCKHMPDVHAFLIAQGARSLLTD